MSSTGGERYSMHTCFIALAPHAITILQSGLRVRRCAVSCQDPIKYENRIKVHLIPLQQGHIATRANLCTSIKSCSVYKYY